MNMYVNSSSVGHRKYCATIRRKSYTEKVRTVILMSEVIVNVDVSIGDVLVKVYCGTRSSLLPFRSKQAL